MPVMDVLRSSMYTVQGESYAMAEATSRTLPPKTVTFTGPSGPSKGI